ncbi:MAG TPA: hypothetical protein VFL83_07600 [Anaeromyxobacter sp.]|nr:hypothetical protein [Anaeromyxobacter sp.]
MEDSTTVVRRAGIGMRGALAWVAILLLLALVLWLASERNARTWYLVPDEGRLVVMRGVLLPVGRHAFEAQDPALAQAYAPVVPPPGKALPPERSFEERSLLDQALFELLSGWAKEEVASADAVRLDRALGYLARAERLPGLSPAQRDALEGLRAESGFHEARRLVARAAGELRDAADKLRRAAGSRSARAPEANALLRDVEPALEAALAADRAAAVREKATPAEAPAPDAPPAAEPAPAADSNR